MKMKKVILLFCVMALSLILAACVAAETNTDAQTETNTDANAAGQTASASALVSAPTSTPTSAPAAFSEDITGEIRVSCFDTLIYKEYLEKSARLFMEKYPGTTVVIETFSSMPESKTIYKEDGSSIALMSYGDAPQEVNDYISRTNTELMSGGGADIFAMDVLPYKKYTEGGMLENLNPYMDNDPEFRRDEYRTSILDTLTKNGAMYIFPLNYRFKYFTYDSTLFTGSEQKQLQETKQVTFEQLFAAGEKPYATKNTGAAEPVKMFYMNDLDLLLRMFHADYGDFVDIRAKDAKFTDGAFVNLLKTVQEYTEKGYVEKSADSVDLMNMTMTAEDIEAVNTKRFFFKSKSAFIDLLQEFSRDHGITINKAFSGIEDNDEIAGLESNKKGEYLFRCPQALGINANSGNKRTAWEFVKFMVSDEELQSSFMFGLPINYNAFLESTKSAIKGEFFSSYKSGEELDEKGQAIFDAYVPVMDQYTDLLNTYITRDAYIDNTVDAEVKNFFDGSKTAEEVANVLQNKISLYLNE
jgi:multiple sugar transport system substrate-binding protein